MNKFFQTSKYIISDFLASSVAWTLFFLFRKIFIEPKTTGEAFIRLDYNFYVGIIIIPLFWILLYFLSGYYFDIYRKSRLKEFSTTFFITLIGVILIFFKLILDDIISSYVDYYYSLLFLFFVQFFLTYIPRFFITSATIKKIHSGKIGFPTIIIGTNGKSKEIYEKIQKMKVKPGNKFIGYIDVFDKKNIELENEIPLLGKFDDLNKIIKKYNVEEVIVAIESSEKEKIKEILQKLVLTDIIIKIIPSIYDIVGGYIKLDTLYDIPFICIQKSPMSRSNQILKRILDIVISLTSIIILSPAYITIAIVVKLSSEGPSFYKQERIGLYGKPFKILKFRSMYIDAEKDGPALSSENDNRITPVGRFLRKTRLDEIPQFFNVLLGQMSIVGPRPERQYYIDQIIKKEPFYLNLLKVKPGITSLGQVKYGYAENVEQMIERSKYDLVYLQNISFYLDFKIMLMTVKTIFEASGK
jgi:exopolysaccharide biosynthesis polyprenyl glycosylphosphotransferase